MYNLSVNGLLKFYSSIDTTARQVTRYHADLWACID